MTVTVAGPSSPSWVGETLRIPTSSGSIRPTAVGTSSVALTGWRSRSRNSLEPSMTESLVTGTEIVPVSAPAGMVSVPELAV